jgi:hypothetical protein
MILHSRITEHRQLEELPLTGPVSWWLWEDTEETTCISCYKIPACLGRWGWPASSPSDSLESGAREGLGLALAIGSHLTHYLYLLVEETKTKREVPIALFLPRNSDWPELSDPKCAEAVSREGPPASSFCLPRIFGLSCCLAIFPHP